MATNAPKPTVSVTPGKNKPVNNVFKFEDLVQNLKQAPPKSSAKKAGLKGAQADELAEIQRLATELEQRLRAIRRAAPAKSAKPTKSASAPRRKTKD